MKKVELILKEPSLYPMQIPFDRVYEIQNENQTPIGVIFLSDTMDNQLYIEWLEILIVFHGNGYLRAVFAELATLFGKEIRFECSEELRMKYTAVGCKEHGISDCTDLYCMTYGGKNEQLFYKTS